MEEISQLTSWYNWLEVDDGIRERGAIESLTRHFKRGEQERRGHLHSHKLSGSLCCGDAIHIRPFIYLLHENMSSPTELHLPPTLPYPIKVASLDVKQAATVQRGTRLLSYSFKYLPSTPGARHEIRFGTWDCPIEGTVEAWNVRVGDEISLQRSKQKLVITILEPCKHGVQVGGLCGICGKDMTGWVPSLSSTVLCVLSPFLAMTTQASLMHRVHPSK